MAAEALLGRRVGPRQARDLLLMPRKLTAAELLKRGLLTEIAAEGAFDQKANEILSSLSDGPPLAYAAIKRNLMAAEELPLAEAIAVEARNMVMTLESRDCSEEIGCAACRDRVWQYGSSSGGAVSLKKKKKQR